MSLRTSLLSFASFLLLSSSVTACGGNTESSGPTGGEPATETPGTGTGTGSETVSVPNVGDVRAVRVTDRRPEDAAVVTASRDSSKVRHIIEVLGVDGALPEATSFPNCRPDAQVELFDAVGKVAGTVEVYCGTTSILRTANDKAYALGNVDVAELVKMEGDRLLVASWLFDISKVEIDQPLKDAHRVLDTREDIDAAVAALSPVDTFDPNAPQTKCVADYTVTFTRSVGEGSPIVSRLYVTCGSDPRASQPAWFQASDDLQGQVLVNAQTIAGLANPTNATTASKQ